jgi:hypothetical protein
MFRMARLAELRSMGSSIVEGEVFLRGPPVVTLQGVDVGGFVTERGRDARSSLRPVFIGFQGQVQLTRLEEKGPDLDKVSLHLAQALADELVVELAGGLDFAAFLQESGP